MKLLRRTFLLSLPFLFFRKLWALSPKIESAAVKWHKKIYNVSRQLRKNEITPAEWQDAIEKIMVETNITDILEYINFFKHQKYFSDLVNVPIVTRIVFPFLNHDDRKVLLPRLMTLHKNVINAPHAHFNMTSVHIVVEGEVEVLTYERIAVGESSCEVKPYPKKILKRGEALTMSEARCNIHSLRALSARATTLVIPICNLGNKKLDHPLASLIGDHQFLFLSPAIKTRDKWLMNIISEKESKTMFTA